MFANILIGTLLFLTVMPAETYAAPRGGSIAAVVTSASGKMESRAAGERKWVRVRPGMFLFEGDAVRTGPNSKGAIVFSNGSEMKINSSSLFTVEAEDKVKRESKVKLFRGRTYSKSAGLRAKVSIRTPVAVVSVRGTEFDTNVDESGDTEIMVVDGIITVSNDFGSVDVNQGQTTSVTGGQAPQPPENMSITEMSQATEWQNEIKIDKKNMKIKFKGEDGKEGTLNLKFGK